MSIRIGITGGIGSGKSVVSKLLEVLDIPVYVSDIEAKKLANTHPRIREELTRLVNPDLYITGELNKQMLASYLFSNNQNAERVNRIIHPVVKQDFQMWQQCHSSLPIVAMESAILIESGFADAVDKIVMVYAPLEIRLQRAMKRDAATHQQILNRIKAQMDDEEKQMYADYMILNDGEIPLIPQVLKLISSLSQNNVYLCDAKK